MTFPSVLFAGAAGPIEPRCMSRFVDELAGDADSIVSMVATVPDDDPTARTYRVVRGPADGTAHAHALAVRHRLTYRQLTERIAS